MSANRYRSCPECNKANKAKLESAYGTVPLLEYEELKRQLTMTDSFDLREDWDITWADEDDGPIIVDYRCSCQKCGFRVAFKDSHPAIDVRNIP